MSDTMTPAKAEQLMLKVQAAEAKYEDCLDGYGAEHEYTVEAENAMVAAQKAADAANKELEGKPLVQSHVSLYSNSFMNLYLCTKRIVAKRSKPARELSSHGEAIMIDGQYLQIDSVKRDGDVVTIAYNGCHGQRTVELAADAVVDMAVYA